MKTTKKEYILFIGFYTIAFLFIILFIGLSLFELITGYIILKNIRLNPAYIFLFEILLAAIMFVLFIIKEKYKKENTTEDVLLKWKNNKILKKTIKIFYISLIFLIFAYNILKDNIESIDDVFSMAGSFIIMISLLVLLLAKFILDLKELRMRKKLIEEGIEG